MMDHRLLDGRNWVVFAAAGAHVRWHGLILEVYPGKAFDFIDGRFSGRDMNLDPFGRNVRAS